MDRGNIDSFNFGLKKTFKKGYQFTVMFKHVLRSLRCLRGCSNDAKNEREHCYQFNLWNKDIIGSFHISFKQMTLDTAIVCILTVYNRLCIFTLLLALASGLII